MIVQKGALEVAGPEGGKTAIAAGVHLDAIVPYLAPQCKGVPDGELVRIIDQRIDDRFDVDRRIVSDWLPVIGLDGLGFYVALCALASGATPGLRPWDIGGDVAFLRRLLLWVGLVRDGGDGAILLVDPPICSRRRLEELQEELVCAVACEISPVLMRTLGRVKALVRWCDERK